MIRFMLFLILPVLLLNAEEGGYITRVAIKAETAQLSDGYDPWTSRQLRADFSKHKTFGLGIAGEELARYGIGDKRGEVSAWLTLPAQLTYSGFIAQTQNGQIIPKESYSNRLALKLFHSWQLAVEKAENRYHGGNANSVTGGGVISYFGPFRLAYTRYHTEVKNAGSAESDKLTLHTFYQTGFTALLVSKGQELEALPHDRILVQDVTAFALFGEYKINTRWALTYSYEYVEQDTLYRRNGVGLGLTCTL